MEPPVSEWLTERGVLVDQSTIYRLGATLSAAVRRSGSQVSNASGSGLASRRDLCSHSWSLALHLSRHRRTRADRRRVCVADARHACRAQVLRAGNRFQRHDAASSHHRQGPTYSPALAAAVPGVLHRTGRYRTNGIERDHGFLKERLRPMRGLKSVASAAIFMRGHALIRNIRRGFYRIVESVPKRLVFTWTWNRLAGVV